MSRVWNWAAYRLPWRRGRGTTMADLTEPADERPEAPIVWSAQWRLVGPDESRCNSSAGKWHPHMYTNGSFRVLWTDQ